MFVFNHAKSQSNGIKQVKKLKTKSLFSTIKDWNPVNLLEWITSSISISALKTKKSKNQMITPKYTLYNLFAQNIMNETQINIHKKISM